MVLKNVKLFSYKESGCEIYTFLHFFYYLFTDRSSLSSPDCSSTPHQIVVKSENTMFSSGHITSKYTNCGADATIINGQHIIKATQVPDPAQGLHGH